MGIAGNFYNWLKNLLGGVFGLEAKQTPEQKRTAVTTKLEQQIIALAKTRQTLCDRLTGPLMRIRIKLKRDTQEFTLTASMINDLQTHKNDEIILFNAAIGNLQERWDIMKAEFAKNEEIIGQIDGIDTIVTELKTTIEAEINITQKLRTLK